ncbi:MAG: trimethylamine methyltransferase family protein [Thermoleophilia bacterium]|nr:trimethylamine methyltransferase family protein [Thermoleophilia bacterium]
MRRNPQAGRRRFGALSLEMFTEDELVDIHQATLEVLGETGIFFEDAEARRLLAAGGCAVDDETNMVRIPPHVVEAAIRSAPSTLLLAGRDPANDFLMGPGRVGFTNFGEGIKIVDPETGELREPTKQDVGDSARVVDALPEVDVYERAIGASDVPQSVVQLHNAEMAFTNTSKHIFMGPGNGELLRRIVDMGAAIAGGMDAFLRRPLISFITCPVSPLKIVQESCEIIMGAARTGTAVNILSMAMAGGSSPVTLAGSIVTHNAEVLAGVTLSQLTKEGAAVVYGSSTTAMDLRLAAASVGTPECALINAGVACLARFYLLPSWVAGA